MPDFWEYPTVSMGLGPISAIYQARFNRYLHNRGLLDTSGSRVWAFLGDGETDEPESLGALHVAAREGLDNLTFVVNCNLQRLDGPVRGNGKIIQELEAVFRGSGWNVIKVVWAREWDELLARDVDGVLVQQMNDTLDGEFQKFSVAGGAYIQEHFFGPDRARKLVEHLSDDDLAKLRRGGHDCRKLYAAYKAATEFKGARSSWPRRSRAGPWVPGSRPATSPTRPRSCPRTSCASSAIAWSCRSPTPSSRTRRTTTPSRLRGGQYIQERRRQLDGPIPRRVVRAAALPAHESIDSEFSAGSQTAVSTTMVFTRILRNLIRDKELGARIVPIIPDEARTFGMDPLFKEVGIYAALGQRYEPVDSDLVLSYREATDGQVLEEGITEAGSMASFQAAGTAYASHPGDDPVLHLLLDVRLPADRRPDVGVRGRARPGLPDGRDRRADDARRRGPAARRRHTHILASTVPNIRAYDPAFAYELAAVVRDGIVRMYGDKPEDVFYYITLYNENMVQPPRPDGLRDEDILRGIYRFAEAPSVGRGAHPARLVGSGRSSARSSPRATCWPRSSASPPRSTAPVVPAPAARGDQALEPAPPGRPRPARPARQPGAAARRTDRRRDRLAQGAAGHGLALAADDVPVARYGRLRAQRDARGPAVAVRDRRPEHRGGDDGVPGPLWCAFAGEGRRGHRGAGRRS